MAHGDILIFLTNITWVFILFLFTYFFFVLFFLPSFYKKVRSRTLIHSFYERVSFFIIRSYAFGPYLLFVECKRALTNFYLSFLIASLSLFNIVLESLQSFTVILEKLFADNFAGFLEVSPISRIGVNFFSGLIVDVTRELPIFNKYFKG